MSSSSSPSAASTPAVRHCALCLKELRGDEIKKCVKCYKRAYCSRDCQAVDWNQKVQMNGMKGQGHKDWCGIDYGEEDIEWKVTPIEGKGLGVVALRDIPVTYRIIVESQVPKTHPGIADLTPLNGTLEEKWSKNRIMYPGLANEDVEAVCLRISRVNHSCNPNAAYLFDKSVQVYILLSLREIKAGEEICISYVGGDGMDKRQVARELLFWGIVCGDDCACNDEEYRNKIKEGRSLVERLKRYPEVGTREEAVDFMQRVLEVGDELNTTVFKRQGLHYGLRCFSLRFGRLQPALEYVAQAYEFEKRIVHPVKGEWVNKYQMLMVDPDLFRSIRDRMRFSA